MRMMELALIRELALESERVVSVVLLLWARWVGRWMWRGLLVVLGYGW